MSESTTVETPTVISIKKKETPIPSVRGMVAYSDAGARPNPGFGGIGIHAYTYTTGVTLKGVGLGNVVASTQGYVPKEETTALVGMTTPEAVAARLSNSVKYQVVPDQYIDYFQAVAPMVTNNLCELKAVKKAVEMAIENEARHLQIYSDSELTCKGINLYLDKWAKNGWLRQDGTEIKNAADWKETKTILDFAKSAGISVKLDWVRGHNGDIGNELADQLATIGVMQSQRQNHIDKEVKSPSEGYWKMVVDRHPMVASPKLYFNTFSGASLPGTYYLGHHGKDDDQLGNRSSDTHIAIVRLSQPIPVIETMRELQSNYNNASDRLYQLFLDRIFMPDHYRFLISHKDMAVQYSTGYRMDLNFVDGPPLTREFKPALISHRIVDAMTELDDVLTLFKAKDPSLQVVNLTDLIYDKTIKAQKKKDIEENKPPEVEYTIKKEFVVGITSMDVEFANPFYPDKPYKLTLTMGQDILERNSLKRLEDLKPDVNLIIWKESEAAFRFATVIQATDCEGIWCAPMSNLRIVLNPEVQAKSDADKLAKAIKKKKKIIETLEPAIDLTRPDEE